MSHPRRIKTALAREIGHQAQLESPVFSQIELDSEIRSAAPGQSLADKSIKSINCAGILQMRKKRKKSWTGRGASRTFVFHHA